MPLAPRRLFEGIPAVAVRLAVAAQQRIAAQRAHPAERRVRHPHGPDNPAQRGERLHRRHCDPRGYAEGRDDGRYRRTGGLGERLAEQTPPHRWGFAFYRVQCNYDSIPHIAIMLCAVAICHRVVLLQLYQCSLRVEERAIIPTHYLLPSQENIISLIGVLTEYYFAQKK